MRKYAWPLLFFSVLAADLLFILLNQEQLRWISKPLIIPALIFYFQNQTRESKYTGIKKWVVFALLFSWLGDVMLMFQDQNELFFVAGLSAFLLAHIFYIIVFHQIRISERINRNLWFMVIIVLYYAVFTSWLSPYLGSMKLPVRIYGVIISFMLLLALHLLSMQNKRAGRFIMIGALLFVISDSVLAINKFYNSFVPADTMIVLSYGIAQFLIIAGLANYIRQSNSKYI